MLNLIDFFLTILCLKKFTYLDPLAALVLMIAEWKIKCFIPSRELMFKILKFFSFQKYYQCQFGSRSGPTFCQA